MTAAPQPPSIRGSRNVRNRQTYHLTLAIIRDHWSERAGGADADRCSLTRGRGRGRHRHRRRSLLKGRDAFPKVSGAVLSPIGEIHSVSRKMERESLWCSVGGGAAFGQRRVPRGVWVNGSFHGGRTKGRERRWRRVRKRSSSLFLVTKAPFSCRFLFPPRLASLLKTGIRANGAGQ